MAQVSRHNARKFRDIFVQQGIIEARYWPLLVFGVACGAVCSTP